MKVLVTGGRTFQDRDWLWAGLDMLDGMQRIDEVIEGGAPGADNRAHEWAYRRERRSVTVPAQWERYGPSAGPIRNTEMAKLKPDIVLACPGGKGTQSMIDIAKAHGLKVVYLAKMPLAKGGTVASAPSPVQIDAAA